MTRWPVHRKGQSGALQGAFGLKSQHTFYFFHCGFSSFYFGVPEVKPAPLFRQSPKYIFQSPGNFCAEPCNRNLWIMS